MLQEKYKELIATAQNSGVTNFTAVEHEGVLRVNGDAPTGSVKDQLWEVYNRIDPNFLSGDVVMDINVATDVAGAKVKVVTEASNLNIRKGPGTDQAIVGKAAHGEIITLMSKANDQWWLVRTKDAEEGYAYAQYLEVVE